MYYYHILCGLLLTMHVYPGPCVLWGSFISPLSVIVSCTWTYLYICTYGNVTHHIWESNSKIKCLSSGVDHWLYSQHQSIRQWLWSNHIEMSKPSSFLWASWLGYLQAVCWCMMWAEWFDSDCDSEMIQFVFAQHTINKPKQALYVWVTFIINSTPKLLKKRAFCHVAKPPKNR